ncbi:type II toxin-antitoxin system CcdA family antitoxin [Azospirillum rugosum]|uniref:Post-segregation antitoxin (Ccd killing protein) n=1 Tax=Azospirillum rugosum TaxID=416170 RepID=A0ABS4SH52_9PROT|nr:type II toxin-antitoxin system CcdA family antitoxin [Azospirillum rugosum]MBP2291902.1 post-segregation antitoxin (ccd killing protein) [Azospirillum rugosum]MDQ0530894.1 post-segregation antitoxin (ccd killing protein) [Azospirillum rugosum]
MRAVYDATARKQTVSVTLNSDLYAKAKEAGVNVSRAVETALAAELERRIKEKIRAEIAQDIKALDDFSAIHGSFADMTREYLSTLDGDETV